ncbi:MAG: ABC transporter permease [Chloroflexota bacterium]
MRVLIVFRKTMREITRDKWMLGLTLAFAPFFVFLYWLWFQGGSTVYPIAVINQDQGVQLADGSMYNAGEEVSAAIQAITYADGRPLLKVISISGQAAAESILRDRGATAFIQIPAGFSHTIQAMQAGDRSVTTTITFGGDLSNTYYMIGANMALVAVDAYVQQATGQEPLVNYVEKPMGASATRTEFETYVPGTLIFSVILLIFLAAMTVAREIETGALRRLQLTPMTSFDLLGGITLALLLVGAVASILSFLVALALGFHSQGPVWVAILVSVVASLSVIGLGLVVASLTRSVSQAFVVANFPLGLMMFFSGVIFPMPVVKLFTIAGHAISPYDILPPTHAVVALNKILTLGASLNDVAYELTVLIILSVIYFLFGVWLFRRMHLRPG